jgi:hypothetical protein
MCAEYAVSTSAHCPFAPVAQVGDERLAVEVREDHLRLQEGRQAAGVLERRAE